MFKAPIKLNPMKSKLNLNYILTFKTKKKKLQKSYILHIKLIKIKKTKGRGKFGVPIKCKTFIKSTVI